MENIKSIVEMKGIEKNFGAVRALRGVDFALGENEVLGLVGDNAAGKSTLMKVLSGAYIPDSGEIYIGGERAGIDGPQDYVIWESRWSTRTSCWQTIWMSPATFSWGTKFHAGRSARCVSCINPRWNKKHAKC